MNSFVRLKIIKSNVIAKYIDYFRTAYHPRPMPMVMYSMAADGMAMSDQGRVPTKFNLAPVTHVRKLFPETWLWESLQTVYV